MFVPLPRSTETSEGPGSGSTSSLSPPRKQLRNAAKDSISWQGDEAVTAPYAMFCDENVANFDSASNENGSLTLPLQQHPPGARPSTKPASSFVKPDEDAASEYRSILVTQLPMYLDTETLKLRIEELFTKEIPKLLRETPFFCVPVAGPPTEEQTLQPGETRRKTENVIHPRHLVNADAFDLPFSICDIRVARPTKPGNTTYAVIDFASPKLMQAALAFFGTTPVLPGTSHHVHLSPHATWAAPVPVDLYHVYIAGLTPETTDADVLEMMKLLGTETPRSIKVVKDAKSRYNRCLGFAFLRYSSLEAATRALQVIQTQGAAYGLMGRRVYVSPSHRQVTKSCNGSIFLANVPADATKRIAFLDFGSHESALAAITHMQGVVLRSHSLACAWSIRRHTTYQEEGIEEDDGNRQAEEVRYSSPCINRGFGLCCMRSLVRRQAFAYEAARALEPIVPRQRINRQTCESVSPKSEKKPSSGQEPESEESEFRSKAERELFWLSFYAADATVSSRKLIEAMNGTQPWNVPPGSKANNSR
ncbi:putative RNA recognition motif domain-containing protein [Neospora caninum Liverpool]|uniref:Putative RNA recognition motif domain-containing protein n=1 Tax=Neospora caninum (strain Liverpool) TaxID=572307 RepID=F0VIW2_NEOCL|nr:putative RNA recognition motif domain-containing protein [Neospora caninum Liverpool]CBZ53673.1 putative RNA recognition motif domain-containing protein [Neospora caninum Liverpool]CEL67663.1 TPA: RNA recognition motif domain-containing protein,putative [Neospora caninum Liverpool]|eukprot:XP_003883705.1 putative RNA recognition motif domain-containing protein [Neospora caninum Liverpool]